MKNPSEQKAIEKGKDWMKRSKNITHDFKHVENVSEHAFKVFESLKEQGWKVEDEVDENLILLSVWWHDSFKALKGDKRVVDELVEGLKSSKIAKEELEDFVEKERLEKILYAIKMHNNIPYFILAGKRMPLLLRILVEADAVDGRDPERKRRGTKQKRSFFHRVGESILDPVFTILRRVYIRSEYAKMKIKELEKQRNDKA